MTSPGIGELIQGTVDQDLPDPWPVHELRRGALTWRSWIGSVISLAVLVAACVQLRRLDVGQAVSLIPTNLLFWLALAGSYMALPVSEWLIYRRLWRLPISGLLPLLRKRISNEILLGYSGEVYFYAWARRRTAMSGAPFGVIKDVAILSAQVGNLVTLLLIAIAWPLLGPLHLGTHTRDLILSSALVVLVSVPPLLFRAKLLTLPAPELWRIAWIHLVRVLAGLLLAAAMWHEALPGVAWTWWLLLAALRQLLSRLPLMPNKDVAFAGLASFLLGPRGDIFAMVAMSASLILAMHLVLGLTLALADLVTPGDA